MNRKLNILALAAVLAFALLQFSDNRADVDLWGNVGFVRSLPWQDGFLRANTFSYTEPDHQWLNHEWLAEYLFHRLWSTGGNPALILFKMSIGMALLALFWRKMRRDSLNGSTAFLTTILILSTIGYGFSTRPHLFTYLALAALLTVLKRSHEPGTGYVVFCFLLAVIWANLHGAFFIGAIVMLVHLACDSLVAFSRSPRPPDAWRRPIFLLRGLIVFLAGSCLTPNGFETWKFITQSAGLFRPYLSEWAPFNLLLHLADHADFVVLALLCVVALFVSRKPKQAGAVVTLFVALVAALLLRRNIPLFALVAAVTMPEHFSDAFGRGVETMVRRLHTGLRGSLAAALLVASLFAVQWRSPLPCTIVVPRTQYPVEIVERLQAEDVHGNLLTFFDWGEYSIWKLFPACRVFMDGRLDCCYSRSVIADYLGFFYDNAPDAMDRALDAYPTDMVLVHAGDPVVDSMMNRPGWTCAFREPCAVLFVRDSVHGELIRRLHLQYPYLPAMLAYGREHAIFP